MPPATKDGGGEEEGEEQAEPEEGELATSEIFSSAPVCDQFEKYNRGLSKQQSEHPPDKWTLDKEKYDPQGRWDRRKRPNGPTKEDESELVGQKLQDIGGGRHWRRSVLVRRRRWRCSAALAGRLQLLAGHSPAAPWPLRRRR